MASELPIASGLSVYSAIQPYLIEHFGRNFFDRAGRGRQPGNVFHTHQALGLGDFMTALLDGGILAIGTPLVAYFGQTIWLYRQAKQFLAIGRQRSGQRTAIEVFGDEWKIGRLDRILHGQIQTGGSLSAAGHTDQNHIGLFQPMYELTVIVSQAEIDGLDAIVVLLGHAAHMRAAHRMAGLDAQCGFYVLHKSAEQIQESTVGLAYALGYGRIDQGAEYQWRGVLLLGTAVDSYGCGLGLFNAIYKRNAYGFEGKLLELRKH